MSTRLEQKQETRHRIIKNTTKLFIENGLIKVSTKDISTASMVAQGSIFVHFPSKNALLEHIIQESINKIENDINSNVDSSVEIDLFLQDLLNVYEKHENMLSRVYKDYGYLNDSQRNQINQLDQRIKNLIFDNIRAHSVSQRSIVDTLIAIDSFISSIRVILQEKEVYTEFNNVIKQRRGKLAKLYRILFK